MPGDDSAVALSCLQLSEPAGPGPPVAASAEPGVYRAPVSGRPSALGEVGQSQSGCRGASVRGLPGSRRLRLLNSEQKDPSGVLVTLRDRARPQQPCERGGIQLRRGDRPDRAQEGQADRSSEGGGRKDRTGWWHAARWAAGAAVAKKAECSRVPQKEARIGHRGATWARGRVVTG